MDDDEDADCSAAVAGGAAAADAAAADEVGDERQVASAPSADADDERIVRPH